MCACVNKYYLSVWKKGIDFWSEFFSAGKSVRVCVYPHMQCLVGGTHRSRITVPVPDANSTDIKS